MPITKEALGRAHAEHGSKYTGVKEDYFGALYLAWRNANWKHRVGTSY